MVHTSEVIWIKLNHAGGLNERKIAFIDNQRDLYIAPIQRHQQPTGGYPTSIIKLATLVDSVIRHEKADMLCCTADGALHCWYVPQCVYIDADLLPRTKHISTGLQSEAQPGNTLTGALPISATISPISIGRGALVRFANECCTYQRADGAECTHLLSPYPFTIQTMARKQTWSNAIQLCRLAKDEASWAVLAVLSLQSNSLETAEIALSPLDEIDKVYGIQYARLKASEK